MRRGGYESSDRLASELSAPPPSLCVRRPEIPSAASGWECPRCRKVWAPHIDRCTCEPVGMTDRTEISEGLAAGLTSELPGVRSGLDKIADAIRSARGGDTPLQVRGFA